MNEKDLLKQSNYLEALEEEQAEFFEPIDPTQPSTSRPYRHEKFHYAHSSSNPLPPPPPTKNRLRAQRQTSKVIAEAAKKNGMQTVDRSGSSFVIPITMQAHPTQLTDRILAEKDDILSQTAPLPYCCHCHSILKTWRGFEYHVLKVHLKYRPFRCYYCQKDSFYTEEEGRFHSSTCHPNEDITLVKEYDVAKENAAQEAFKSIYLMCRDGPLVTKEKVFEWEQEAARQVMKFQFLRFKRPIVVTKKLPTVSREVQTELTSVRMIIPPILSHEHQTPHLYPSSISLATHQPFLFQDYHHVEPLPPAPILPRYHPHHHGLMGGGGGGGRPRSTATQHDEDPRDREKFFSEWPL